eukprot:8173098-Pyramimonas_sp.AAC.1
MVEALNTLQQDMVNILSNPTYALGTPFHGSAVRCHNMFKYPTDTTAADVREAFAAEGGSRLHDLLHPQWKQPSHDVLRLCFRASDKTNRDMSFLYQLGSVSLYIGQGLVARTSSIRSGVLSRLREHLRGLQCARAGHPHPGPHRYRCLLRGCEK